MHRPEPDKEVFRIGMPILGAMFTGLLGLPVDASSVDNSLFTRIARCAPSAILLPAAFGDSIEDEVDPTFDPAGPLLAPRTIDHPATRSAQKATIVSCRERHLPSSPISVAPKQGPPRSVRSHLVGK